MYASNKLKGRAPRVLALVAVLCLMGAAFYFLHAPATAPAAAPAAAAMAPERYVKGPDPSAFKSFVYDPVHPSLAVSGTCTDAYYALLIYPAGVDYRESPLDAKYNTTGPCAKGTFSADINLAGLPLRAGARYYLIRAQEGAAGQWYDAH